MNQRKRTLLVTLVLAAGLLVVWFFSRSAPSEPVDAHPTRSEVTAQAVGSVPTDRVEESARSDRVNSRDARTEVRLRVHVRDEAGRPVVGAAVHDCRSETPPVPVASDAEGSANLPRETRGGEIVVLADHHVAAWTEVEANATEHLVTLVAGTALDGRLLVDGIAPDPGLALILNAEPAPGSRPAAKNRHAGELLALAARHPTRTQADGTFRFEALPLDWRGSVVVPQTHWVLGEDDKPALDVTTFPCSAPTTFATIRTTKLPSLRGRVLYDDGTPAFGARVIAKPVFADGTKSSNSNVVADAEGRFAVGFHPQAPQQFASFADPARRPALVRVSLKASAEDADPTTLDWPAEVEPTATIAAEVQIRLVRWTRNHFVVRDADEQPIAGARMLAKKVSEPTDANGRGIALGTPIAVGARNHAAVAASASVHGTGREDDPLVYSLPHAADLVLRARRTDGEALRGGYVQLLFGDEFLPSLVEWLPLYRAVGLHGDGITRRTDGASTTTFHADGENTIRMPCPPTGTRFRVCIRDSMRTSLAELDVVVPPEPREPIDLVASRGVCDLRGRVHARGAPLPNATVWLRNLAPDAAEPEVRRMLRTDSSGSFALPCVALPSRLEVRVAARGFVSCQLVVEAGPDLDIAMFPGRSVTVTVLDDEAHAVAEPNLFAVTAGGVQPATARDENSGLRFDDLPSDAVVFRCAIAGREFETTAQPGAATAILRLPQFATLRVRGNARELGVKGRCLEPEGLPFEALPQGGACRLPPGRYRFDNAIPAEVALRAGETAEIAVH